VNCQADLQMPVGYALHQHARSEERPPVAPRVVARPYRIVDGELHSLRCGNPT